MPDDFDLIPTGDATGERNASRLRERFTSVGGDVEGLQEATKVDVVTVTFAAAGPQAVAHGLGTAEVGYRVVCRIPNTAGSPPGLWDYQAPDKYNLFLETDDPLGATFKIEVKVL